MNHPEGKPTRTSIPAKLDCIAESVEREIERLKELRPTLEARIDRAASILVLQLSSRRDHSPMRVRVGADKRPRVLVASSTAGGAVYVVDPTDWSCTCPDYHRRGGEGVCKHAVATFLLWRVGKHPRGCPACHGGTVYLTHEEGGQERTEPMPCRRCGGKPG